MTDPCYSLECCRHVRERVVIPSQRQFFDRAPEIQTGMQNLQVRGYYLLMKTVPNVC
jgi:hypothetical protein